MNRVAAIEQLRATQETLDVTVADWKARRSAGIYPGLAIDVLGDGNAVAGNTKLGTVRDSYADE